MFLIGLFMMIFSIIYHTFWLFVLGVIFIMFNVYKIFKQKAKKEYIMFYFGVFIVALSVMEACVEVEKHKKVKTEE